MVSTDVEADRSAEDTALNRPDDDDDDAETPANLDTTGEVRKPARAPHSYFFPLQTYNLCLFIVLSLQDGASQQCEE